MQNFVNHIAVRINSFNFTKRIINNNHSYSLLVSNWDIIDFKCKIISIVVVTFIAGFYIIFIQSIVSIS